MKVYKPSSVDVLFDMTCDICGISCRDDYGNIESATLYGEWGYGSSKDGEVHECNLCEKCYDAVSGYIKSLGGSIRGS